MTKPKLKFSPTVLILSLIVLAYIQIFYDEIVGQFLVVSFYVGSSLLLFGVGVFGAILFLYAQERIKILRADRIARERDAHLTIIQNDKTGMVFTRDTDTKAIYHALHLEQKTYSNGHYQPASNEEMQAWQHWINTQLKTTKPALVGEVLPALPEGGSIRSVDLLTELDYVQRCLIVAPSDGGKTTLLQWIVSRRLPQAQVIVIDPHSYPKKWLGCDVVGAGRNYVSIENTLDALIDLMTNRYAEIGRGEIAEGQHDKIVVIIDEWRAIVRNVSNAAETIGALLTESRKAAFSVFMGTHSERVKALGLDGEGDLKDGFTMVRLGFNGGERVGTIDYGNGEINAILPGVYHPHEVSINAPKSFIIPTESPIGEIEQTILDMRGEKASYRAIAREVYDLDNSEIGSQHTNKIKQILAKHGLK